MSKHEDLLRELYAAISAGATGKALVAAFYVFRDGLVLRQSSYDCYEPIAA